MSRVASRGAAKVRTRRPDGAGAGEAAMSRTMRGARRRRRMDAAMLWEAARVGSMGKAAVSDLR
ncbi:hypothetical protein AQ477_03605 [Burkholderia thailandensis]|nr:hypothetical protein AQ477_03605 [Burkholderia thailandensis]KXF60313.1 hypothetical protein AQ476_02735 [Burkholderia thailandensis]PNE75633.1 hypothetical protein A8H37_29060 [Burkholderia thailandensis]